MNQQPRLWWTFALTSLALFAFTLDRLVVATALPAIRIDLGAQAADLEWTVNAFTLSFAALLLTGAALGDRFGRRRMFTIGVAVFTAGSAAAALAPTIGTLVAARALQGVGGALFTPLTLTMLSAVTPPARRGAVLGAWGGIGGLGAALGPVAGGALAGSVGWRVIFWLNVPVGLVLIALGWRRLAESRGPRRNLDLAGVVLGSAGLCGVVWAVIRVGVAGWSSMEVLPALSSGAALLVLFARWEHRTPAPMLPMHFFRSRVFGACGLASLMMYSALFGALFLIAQLLQTGFGETPLQAGLRTLPMAVMPILLAPAGGVIADRIGYRPLMICGLAAEAIALGWLAAVVSPTVAYALLIPPLVLAGAGSAVFFAPLASAMLSAVAPQEHGQASGAATAIRELGAAGGVAVLGLVFAGHGGYASPADFVGGFVPAMWLATGLAAAGVVAAAALPRAATRPRASARDRAACLDTGLRSGEVSGGRIIRCCPVLPVGWPDARLVCVMPYLLERQVELQMLGTAVERAGTGRGSAVLVLGEAGIGKTSLMHAFLAAMAGRARILAGICEDLLTPRALGPLRDAARSAPGGPLAGALSPRADPGLVLAAACDELASPPSPAVLVIEDAHWADGATLDVLRYLGTRVQNLPAVLLVTYRDDALARDHPLRRVLGVLGSTAATRLRLTPLTLGAVSEMAAPTGIDAGELFRLTGGNPFYITEVLANPSEVVPPTVVDAVLARVRMLSPPAQDALDRLAVIPSGAEVGLLRALAGDLAPVAEAERAGVVELRDDVVAFRHELARRAVVESLPASDRLELNAEVLRALLTRPERDPFRVLHHAVEAGDDDAVVTYGQEAAREARRVGAHRQAAACYAQVLVREHLLSTSRRAALGEAYAWALSNANELHCAVAAAATAAELWQEAGDDRRLVRALVNLSRQQWLTERTAAALVSAERALELARPLGDSYQNALATLNVGGLLVLTDREQEGQPYLREALGIAGRCGAASVAALCRNYLGSAQLQLGDRGGRDELLRSMAEATGLGNDEYVMRAYYNLVEGLWRLGEYREALGYIEQAENFGRDRDFRAHGYMFAARRCRLALMRGQWADAEAKLRELLDGQDDPGMVGRETIPILARLLVRQGSADASEWLALADRYAARGNVLEWLVPTGLAHIEHAWLTGDRAQARHYPELLLERTDRPGTLVQRGELLVYLRRLGYPAGPFPGCPEPYASALRGDWRSAADAWLSEGDPYERAVELAESGQVEPTVEALTVLDGLGAVPAVAVVRGRLRHLGVTRLPRRPQPGTLTNPGGLTDRQLEILRLLATGLSNADIASRLVVSPRTVDHHVSAILQKLGVRTRRDAAAWAAELASKPSPAD